MEIENQPNLQKIEKITEQAKSIESEKGFMQPGSKEKIAGKRGRPSKEDLAKRATEQKQKAQGSPSQADVPPELKMLQAIPTKEIVRPLVQVVSGLGVQYVGDPRAAMKPEELEAGAQALGFLVDKYLPNAMSKYGAEAMCLLVFGQYGLRLVAMKKVLAYDQALARQQAASQTQTHEPKIKTEESEIKGPTAVHPDFTKKEFQ